MQLKTNETKRFVCKHRNVYTTAGNNCSITPQRVHIRTLRVKKTKNKNEHLREFSGKKGGWGVYSIHLRVYITLIEFCVSVGYIYIHRSIKITGREAEREMKRHGKWRLLTAGRRRRLPTVLRKEGRTRIGVDYNTLTLTYSNMYTHSTQIYKSRRLRLVRLVIIQPNDISSVTCVDYTCTIRRFSF